MGCVQCKDKEAAKLTDNRDTSTSQGAGYHYGADPTPQHYPSFGVTAIPNYNNFHAPVGQGLTVFGGVSTSSNTGTLRTRGGTGKSHVMLVRYSHDQKCMLCIYACWAFLHFLVKYAISKCSLKGLKVQLKSSLCFWSKNNKHVVRYSQN